MPRKIENCIVAVRSDEEKQPSGAGFVIAPGLVVTCAHVVNACLGLAMDNQIRPDSHIVVTFVATASTTHATATVVEWVPPRSSATVGPLADVAILRINDGFPSGVAAAPIRIRQELRNSEFWVLGYPEGIPTAQSQSGIVGTVDAHQRYELLVGSDRRNFLRPGFSGAPVIVQDGVVGIVVAARVNKNEAGYMLSAEHMRDLLSRHGVEIPNGVVDDFPHIRLIQTYFRDVVLRTRTGPDFDVRFERVTTTERIAQLFREAQKQAYGSTAKKPENLIDQPDFRLLMQSPGGAGKSNFLSSLVAAAINQGTVPFFLNFAARGDEPGVGTWDLARLMKYSEGGGIDQLYEAVQRVGQGRVLLVADRLNENPANAALILQTLLNAVKSELAGVRVIVADRVKDRIREIHPLERATLLPLPIDEITRHLGESPSGVNAKLLAMPFFLDLQLVSGAGAERRTRSEMFRMFFEVHVGIRGNDLEHLARTAYQMYRDFQSTVVPLSRWSEYKFLAEEVKAQVLEGAMLRYRPENTREDVVEFRHQLLHDYLAGTHLFLGGRVHWCASEFDAATLNAQSFDALEFAAEQLAPTADDFLVNVYDWNYVAVLEAIRNLDAGRHGGQSPVSPAFKDAVYCLNALRLFDRFAHTRRRITSIIGDLKTSAELHLATVASIEELKQRVRSAYNPDSAYLRNWKELFLREEAITVRDVPLLWKDPFVSWTASNVFRSLSPNATVVTALEVIYDALFRASLRESVATRWRIVHVLGVSQERSTQEFLWSVVINEDEDKWVRLGASRSLIEVASLTADRSSRKALLDRVAAWLQEKSDIPDTVLQELRNTAIIASGESAPEGWYEDYRHVLRCGREHANKVNDPEDEQAWSRKLEDVSRIIANGEGARG